MMTDHYSSTADLSPQKLWACREIAYGDCNAVHHQDVMWLALQDRETIYVFATPQRLIDDEQAGDVAFVEARSNLIGWIHVDDDLLADPENILRLA